MYICICVYVYICICICMCVYVHEYACIYIQVDRLIEESIPGLLSQERAAT